MRYHFRILAAIVLVSALAGLTACQKPPAESAPPAADSGTQTPTGLAAIPAPEPSQYLGVHNMKDWKNPYLIVRADGIGLVDLDNHEIKILQPEEIPTVLNSLPPTAWPYGRIVLVSQVVPEDASGEIKAQLRKNRGLLAGTLKDLKVLIHEVP